MALLKSPWVDLVKAAVEDRRGLVARGEQVGGAERLGQPRLHELRDRPARRGEHRQARLIRDAQVPVRLALPRPFAIARGSAKCSMALLKSPCD